MSAQRLDAVRSTPIRSLPGVGARRAELLEQLGLQTVDDLLHHFPRRYEDRRSPTPISGALEGETQVLHGRLDSVRQRALRGGRSLIEARLVDAGRALLERTAIDLVWFNQAYLLEWIRPGLELFVYGQVKRRSGRLQMQAPEFELDVEAEDSTGGTSPHIQRIVPIYPLTRGLQQRFLRGLIFRLLEGLSPQEGPYDHFHPGRLSDADAFVRLHFPTEWKDVDAARERFRFEEYFVFATHLHLRRKACRKAGAPSFRVTEELDGKIRSVFPFELTREQEKAVEEICADLRGPAPLYRLLQGDVGTGKTAVALYAMLVAVRNRHQAALLAPTEVLAEQHFRTISRALARHPVRIALLTGSVRGAERREILARLESGEQHIVIGTQALLQESVRFHRLGLAVIDEQHRFGVLERMRIRRKAENPHILVMTATPIPRSLCLTCYGDLDLSILRERPMNRQPVQTVLIPASKRAKAMALVERELRSGRQAYFVYPLIEESETLALPAASQARDKLAKEVFPGYRVGLLHGKLAPAQKDAELEKFRRGEYHVLVATVVVEVGIDVPNASVLFLEDASRFGLSQLHQLRGRVGRGSHPGYCLVGVEEGGSGGARDGDTLLRLKAFAATEDGFRIAEEDLKLRGPGDYLGLRQSGRPHFLLGNPLEDLQGFLRVKGLCDALLAGPDGASYLEKWSELLDLAHGAGEPGFTGLD